MMGIPVELILVVCIVFSGLTFVEPYNQIGGQLSSLLDLFSKNNPNNPNKTKISIKTLKHQVSREQQAFNAMEEELQIAQNVNILKKRNFFELSKSNEHIMASKREAKKQDPDVSLSTVTSVEDGTVELNDKTARSPKPRKALSGSQTLLTKKTRGRTKSTTEITTEIPQIHHNREYQLPAVVRPQRNHTHDNNCDCNCHAERDKLYSLLKKLLGTKDIPHKEEEMTFDDALEHAEGWLLRLAKSRVLKVRLELEEAKKKFSQVFEHVNKELGDVAGEIDIVYAKICRKLEDLDEPEGKSKEQYAPQEFVRREIARHLSTRTNNNRPFRTEAPSQNIEWEQYTKI